jgi:hypothetical protein
MITIIKKVIRCLPAAMRQPLDSPAVARHRRPERCYEWCLLTGGIDDLVISRSPALGPVRLHS